MTPCPSIRIPRTSVVAGALAFLAAVPTALGAQPPEIPDLSSGEIDRRLDFLTERLERRQFHAAAWQYGWTGIYVGSITYNAVKLEGESDGKDRVSHGVTIAKAGLGLFQILWNPHPLRSGADPMLSLPAGDRSGRAARLRRGEALLTASARRSRKPYQLSQHLGILGVNALGGAVIWAFGDSDEALFSTVSGIIGGELRLWSQPWHGAGDLEAYRSRFGSSATGLQWRILPTWRGAVLEVRF